METTIVKVIHHEVEYTIEYDNAPISHSEAWKPCGNGVWMFSKDDKKLCRNNIGFSHELPYDYSNEFNKRGNFHRVISSSKPLWIWWGEGCDKLKFGNSGVALPKLKILKNNLKSTTILTESEFKEIFKLDEGYKIPKSTLKLMSNYIKGSYLLYQDLKNIRSIKFNMNYRGKLIKLKTCYDANGCHSYQKFLKSLGSPPKLEIYYFDKYRNEFNPFWTTNIFKNDVEFAFRHAYETFISNIFLGKISRKYVKYGISIAYHDYRDSYHNPIRLEGVKFPTKLCVIKPNKLAEYLGEYQIIQAIANFSGIWPQTMLLPVKRILESVKQE